MKAPIHSKLAEHRKEPDIEALSAILEDHHDRFPPAFVWAPDLILIIRKMQNEINQLKAELETQRGEK